MITKLINEIKITETQLIEEIKEYLVDDAGDDNWKEFVDLQKLGDCQYIAGEIFREFKKYGIKTVFGEIEIDDPYIDEYDKEQILITHHWNYYKGNILDFSKGTLKYHIDFSSEIYDPEDNDEWRYK